MSRIHVIRTYRTERFLNNPKYVFNELAYHQNVKIHAWDDLEKRTLCGHTLELVKFVEGTHEIITCSSVLHSEKSQASFL